MLNSASKSETSKPSQFQKSEIWTAGEDNLETYYIYGLLAANETIFAFAEGRIERHDKSAHHIVLKKSTDNGATWSENNFVITSENDECFCNPTPIYEQTTGRLFLFYARNYENNRSEFFLISSEDNGETWSEPKNLTALFKDNSYGWTLHLPGPGHGIQMRHGRLIIQVWHRRPITFPIGERNYGVSIIFSDDNGENWWNGGTIPLGEAQLNESRIVEIENGELILNARSGAFVNSPRYFSRSNDGGLNWSEPEEIYSLPPAFATNSGFVSLSISDKEFLIFAHPSETKARKNLTAYLSEDKGESWQISKTIYEGFSGYSDCVVLPDKSIGIIYGRDLLDENADVEGNVKRTMFARFTLDWLLKS